MADKTELQLKAAEKRFDAIERAIETLKKDIESQNVGALPQEGEDDEDSRRRPRRHRQRLSIQMVLKKDLSTANQLKDTERDKEGKALELRMQAEAKSQADKLKKEAEKKTGAQIAKVKAEVQAQIDKVRAQADKSQAQMEKAVTETRIVTLEARLKAVEARVPK